MSLRSQIEWDIEHPPIILSKNEAREIDMNNFDFGKHDILFRCNSCGKERNVPVEFVPDLSDECRVGGTKMGFNPNPDDIRCLECNGLMQPTIYMPDIIGE